MAQGDSVDRLKEAQNVAKSDPRQAEQIYKDIVSKPPSINSDAATREYETALISLGELYRDEKKIQELVDLITSSRTVLSSFAKAKTAKLSRSSPRPLLLRTFLTQSPQSVSFSTSARRFPIRPTPRSPSPSHA
jgi:hypothetical protein